MSNVNLNSRYQYSNQLHINNVIYLKIYLLYKFQIARLAESDQSGILTPPNIASVSQSPSVSIKAQHSFGGNGEISDNQQKEIIPQLEAAAPPPPKRIETPTMNPIDECFAAMDNRLPDENQEMASEVCSLAGSCCDSRRSPCHGDDQVSLASWHSFPIHCPHYRMHQQRNMTTGPHLLKNNQEFKQQECQHQVHHMPSPAVPGHLHPMTYNRISYIPHQPSSLPEQGSDDLDLIKTSSRNLHLNSKSQHKHCSEKQSTNFELQTRPYGHHNTAAGGHHHHHHSHPVHHQHSNLSSSLHCSPLRHQHSTSFRMNHESSLGLQRSHTLDSPQQRLFRPNYSRTDMQESSQMSAGLQQTYPEKIQGATNFSALSPADLCGYASDSQDSRCCQSSKSKLN